MSKVPNPKDLFTALHHRYLCEGDWEMLPPLPPPPPSPATLSDASSGGTGAGALAGHGGVGRSVNSAASSATQEMCLRAMAAVYSAHAGVETILCERTCVDN